MGRLEHLRGLLIRHQPVDAVEAGHVRRMLELCESAGDPFSRNHFVPGHFTASSFVLSPRGDALLLVLHGKLHRWLQPGGHVDPEDADVIGAARREVAEEVGIEDLEGGDLLDVDIHEIPPLGGAPSHEHFDVRFLFRAASRAHQAGSDAADSRWFAMGEIDAVASDASVMRAVEKIRR